MDAELTRLEQQIEQLVTLYQGLQEENRSLHLRAAELEVANQALSGKVRDAVARVESLLQKLPES